MNHFKKERRLIRIIHVLVLFFMAALIVSGITAFPLESELRTFCSILGISTDVPPDSYTGFHQWIARVYKGVSQTNLKYPFLAYGTDWLAFAHIGIAIAFLGVYFKPVRNIWIVYWAITLCILTFPVILICGAIREIPFYWQLVDASFGLFGLIPLFILRYCIRELEHIRPKKY